MRRACLARRLSTWLIVLISEDLRGERDDLHEVPLAQLSRHRPEDASAAWVVLGRDEDGGVLIEAYLTAVGTVEGLDGADDDRPDHVTLLDLSVGLRHLDGPDDDVANRAVLALAAAEHANAEELASATVVGHPEDRLLLDHVTSPSR